MFRLEVFHDTAKPTATTACSQAQQMIDGVNAMIRRYPECLRIDVLLGECRLFACDREGNRVHV